jgi:hypothetical protein
MDESHPFKEELMELNFSLTRLASFSLHHVAFIFAGNQRNLIKIQTRLTEVLEVVSLWVTSTFHV